MSILRSLASHVTAADLQTPLGPTLSLSDNVSDAEHAVWGNVPTPREWTRLGGDEDMDTVCLVRSPDGRVTHAVTPWDIVSAERTVAEAAVPILPEDCVASSTPGLQLLRVFAAGVRPWALVLTDTRLTGFLNSMSFSKPDFSVCLFAALLDVEQRCAEALANHDDVHTAWARLSPGRQEKAARVYDLRQRQRRGRPETLRPPEVSELVFCTTFADKASMLSTLPAFADISRRRLTADFRAMEDCRNPMAHTGWLPMGLDEMAKVIELVEGVLTRLAPRDGPAIRLVKSDTSMGVR